MDLAISGGVALDVLSGVLVVKGDFEIKLGHVQNDTYLTAGQDADAMVLTLSDVGVFVGLGGSLATPTTPGDWSTSDVENGTLGFGATVSSLTLVSIKDLGADGVAGGTDDVSYLGVALDTFKGDLIGLDALLVFHAYDVDALLNSASDSDANPATTPTNLDWSSFGAGYTGLDIGTALTNLNNTTLGALDQNVDLAISGGVALDVLSGVLVVKGDFEIKLGHVQNDTYLTAGQDADAMVLTLSDVGVFVGLGGSLATPTTPGDWSTSDVENGTLGFGATVSSLTLVSIKDLGADGVAGGTDDVSYLGVALDTFKGDLIGLDALLVFHAYDVDALLNSASDSDANPATTPTNLDWSSFGAGYTGLDIGTALTNLNNTTLGALDQNVDLAISGGVALDVLSGVLVVKGDFEIKLGHVQNDTYLTAGQDTDAMVLTLLTWACSWA